MRPQSYKNFGMAALQESAQQKFAPVQPGVPPATTADDAVLLKKIGTNPDGKRLVDSLNANN
jgi:hypothetical protein